MKKVLIATMVSLLLAGPAVSQPWGMGPGMMGWGWDGGWGVFGLMHVLWWIVLVVGAVLLGRWLIGRGGGNLPPGEDRARAILRERYARGEIDKAEFDMRLRDLT